MTERRKRVVNFLKEKLHLPSRSPTPSSSAGPTLTAPTSESFNLASTPDSNLTPAAAVSTQDFMNSVEQPQPDPIPINPTGPAERAGVKAPQAGLSKLNNLINQVGTICGPLKPVVNGLAMCVELFESNPEDNEEYEKLQIEMDTLCMDLSNHLDGSNPPVVTDSVTNLIEDLRHQVLVLVDKKERRSQLSRHEASMETTEDLLVSYRRINWLLSRVNTNLNMEMWKILDELVATGRLDRLSNSKEAKYRTTREDGLDREGCTPNTRVDILHQMREWASHDKSEKIYWLNGMAGTGKTTIACSMCKYLEETRRLAASFFCSRQLPACRDVNRIVPSLAYQLASFSRPFRYALSRVLEENPEAHIESLEHQFRKLIIDPLNRTQDNAKDSAQAKDVLPGNLIIVIDALDECDNLDGAAQILNVLLSHAQVLPLKFFVASRPEPKILDRMRTKRDEQIELRLHELDHSTVSRDIKAYLAHQLQPINLSPADLNTLTNRSGALFIYAATVARYLQFDNFSRYANRLSRILSPSSSSSSNSYQGVDELYTQILGAAFHNSKLEEDEKREMELVLHTVLCAQQPLTVDAIAGLLNLDKANSVLPSLQPFLSVLQVRESDELVTTLHESFPDYMLDKGRSDRLWCDSRAHHGRLAERCVRRLILSELAFHICEPEPSHLLHYGILNQQQKIKDALSMGLSYACRYWAAHLNLADSSESLINSLHELVANRLLLWVEILNLMQCVEIGAQALERLWGWCTRAKYPIAPPFSNDYQNSLGNAYLLLFHYSGLIDQLDKAFTWLGGAIEHVQDLHPKKPIYLSDLAKAHLKSFRNTKNTAHITKAVDYLSQATFLCPPNHPAYPQMLLNLGDAHEAMFETSRTLGDVSNAVELKERAVALFPNGHLGMDKYLVSLGNAYRHLFSVTGLPGDASRALDAFKQTAVLLTGCPYYRLRASIAWAQLSDATGESALEAYSCVFQILPQILQQYTTRDHTNWLTTIMQDLSREAVALAISAQQYDLAIKWLEHGRCFFWRQMLSSSILPGSSRNNDSEILKEVQNVSSLICCTSMSQSHEDPTGYNGASLEDVSQYHQGLVERREELIKTLQQLPEFARDHHLPTIAELVSHGQDSIIIILNAHPDRSDALVLHTTQNQTVTSVALHNSSYEWAEKIWRKFGRHIRGRHRGFIKRAKLPASEGGPGFMEYMLRELWNNVVHPVLDHLGINHVLPIDALPHLIWCPTGPLSLLPLHAAGDYSSPETILSNVAISSYTPNLTCLNRSVSSSTPFSGILTVGYNFAQFTGAKAELDTIQEQFKSRRRTCLNEEDAHPDRVLKAMADHNWVHFSCGGFKDDEIPLKSGLLLHDGRLDLAAIAENPIKGGQFAFLSACDTAAGSQELPDEALHLAAGLLMSGYSSVIATTGSIEDDDAVIVARKVYEYLLEDGVPDSRKAAKALHKATAHLRDTIGVDKFQRWIPYVHFGR